MIYISAGSSDSQALICESLVDPRFTVDQSSAAFAIGDVYREGKTFANLDYVLVLFLNLIRFHFAASEHGRSPIRGLGCLPSLCLNNRTNGPTCQG